MRCPRRRRTVNFRVFLLLLLVIQPWQASSFASEPLTIVIQSDEHLAMEREMVKAAFAAASVPVSFEMAPLANEKRQLLLLEEGKTHIDLMPVTPERLRSVREGKSRMIPIPLDRGMLGYRLCLVLRNRQDLLANVKTAGDLKDFVFGQGEGWMDVGIYNNAGIGTKWVRDWRNAEFVTQMEAGYIDIFPLGAEESLAILLPHFQKYTPEIVADPYIVLSYPWYRFVWLSVRADNADEINAALTRGFGEIAKNGTFEELWRKHHRGLPDSFFSGRRIIKLTNPYYGEEIVGKEYLDLLLVRSR